MFYLCSISLRLKNVLLHQHYISLRFHIANELPFLKKIFFQKCFFQNLLKVFFFLNSSLFHEKFSPDIYVRSK